MVALKVNKIVCLGVYVFFFNLLLLHSGLVCKLVLEGDPEKI